MSKTVIKTDQKVLDPWEIKDPCKTAPVFAQLGTLTLTAGGSAVSDAIAAVIPDDGITYVIDDVVLTVTTAMVEGSAGGHSKPTVALGVYAANSSKDDADYFITATSLADKAKGLEYSVSNGGLTWAATADTLAERTLKGPLLLRVTSVLYGTGGAGAVSGAVRYHAAGYSAPTKYPSLITEPVDL